MSHITCIGRWVLYHQRHPGSPIYFTHSINSVCMSTPIAPFIPPLPCPLGIYILDFYVYVFVSALQIRSSVTSFQIQHICIIFNVFKHLPPFPSALHLSKLVRKTRYPLLWHWEEVQNICKAQFENADSGPTHCYNKLQSPLLTLFTQVIF